METVRHDLPAVPGSDGPKWTIRWKLSLLLVAALVPFLALTLFWSYRRIEAERDQLRLDTLRFAVSAGLVTDEFISSTEQLLMAIATYPAVEKGDPVGTGALLRALKGKYPYLLNLVVVDGQGKLVAAARGVGGTGPVSFADQRWFQEVARTRRLTISELLTGRLTGVRNVTLAYPVVDAGGALRCAVVAPVDLQRLKDAFGALMLPAEARVTIIDRYGTILVHLGPEEGWVGRGMAEHPLYRRITNENKGYAEGAFFDGVERLIGFAPASRAPWHVVVALPAAEARAVLYREAARALVLLAAAAAAATVLAYAVSRRIVRPIDRLAVGAYAVGRGNLEHRVPVTTQDEIGQLTEAFNRMAERLRDDAAEKGRLYEEVRASKTYLESLIESSRDAIATIDLDLTIRTWNRGAERIFGWAREEVVGCPSPIVPPEDLAATRERIARMVQRRESVEFESVRLHKDGRLLDVSITLSPILDTEGRVVGILGISRDITERKRLQRQILVSEKLAAVGQLAAGVAHELNNPLATIAGCAEGLRKRARADALRALPEFRDFPEYLELIEEEGYRCKEITSNLLQFVREPGTERGAVDVNQLLDQAVNLVKHQARFHALQIVQDLAPEVPPVVASAGQVRQVFLALMLNALEASEGKGTLTLRTRRGRGAAGEEVLVEFQDEGAGIPEADLARVFEPFFTTKAAGKGTGLGLSICHGIITDHGGRIEVESRLGKGSLFRVALPAGNGGGEGSS